MELEGRLWKSGKFWLIEVPAIDVCTQGYTRRQAIKMIEDAIETLLGGYFSDKEIKDFKVCVHDYKKGIIGITSSNNNLMLSLSLIRQREKSKSTIREVSKRLGSSSPNSYAQYERGRMRVSLDQYERLLHAANPNQHFRLRVV